ncbi:hypothetical protein, unlikely [Trypanosoma brucei gambiense DAL972]|uniref:Uncharacterized protein n=1 Tax=Trypanosoma brucei gambiense (strain MHOM/CI/86/DAL972) TaxID=679716 RepID=C9ZJR0_TRYB9|nr:hypothetical protein, unlikely [Trypanosoma brucei gambiense DAL972]CBH09620.1 hypothetical protein, unlikely [Trypanosoma brucei gambiense DAL972]|eukprot:XP_011771924.1 hypothetical protein, unlikely [Trypanosoma brucei gambiense DAL972]
MRYAFFALYRSVVWEWAGLTRLSASTKKRMYLCWFINIYVFFIAFTTHYSHVAPLSCIKAIRVCWRCFFFFLIVSNARQLQVAILWSHVRFCLHISVLLTSLRHFTASLHSLLKGIPRYI